jgi:Tannase-like family of unknown function (DUF6351)
MGKMWVTAWACLVVLAALAVAPGFAGNKLEIVTLSTQPDKVSGGDVLVSVRVPPSTKLGDVTITLNGQNATGAFSADPANHTLVGLVAGMVFGKNTLEAKAKGAGADTLEIQNHPITGPIFSGPQETPFFCQTHQFRPYPNAPFLTTTQIGDPCFVAPRVDYVYRTTAGAFAKFDPAGPPPPNLATTLTGVPYIVRLETGTINRAIYQTAILDNPAIPGPDLRNHGDPGWNGRLVYTFGGGCGGGHYIQGSSTGGALNDMMLSRGFAVASSSLNVLGNNCNDVVSAETLLMVKERFIETFGAPRYTMGFGCSGGAIQQYMIGNNYPGLLDGLVPQCSFPDMYGTGTFDSRLMLNYFVYKAGVPWTQDEIRAASGFGTFGQIYTQGTSWAARIDPDPVRPGFPPAIPGFPPNQSSWLYNAIVPIAVRYDPVNNPTGARATTYDHNVNTFGVDENGFARRPLDNVGVQYGLAALNAGQITKEQFLDLNEMIGGLDIDANFIPQRMVADPDATRAAYQTGKVISGGPLGSVPILDVDVIYTDQSLAGDVHMKYNHFVTRQRLVNANGHADNMVMWSGVFGPRASQLTQAFLQMAAWLDNITADTSDASIADKVVRNKPAALTDGCWTGTTAPFSFIVEPQFLGGPGTSACNDLYPGYLFPRSMAGMPLRNDVVKCHLRPLDLADYAVTLTPAEQARLRRMFPAGVCDYTRPGFEQQDLLDTWLIYVDVGKYKKDNAGNDDQTR